MSIYSIDLASTSTASTTALGDFKAASSNQPRIIDVAVNLGTANATNIGLGRAANTPVQTGATFLIPDNPNDPNGLSACATTWSVAPTVPAQFLRRAQLVGVIGAGIIWTFPRGLIVASSGDIVLWNIAAGTAPENFHFMEDE
jgi:hypothetical protein